MDGWDIWAAAAILAWVCASAAGADTGYSSVGAYGDVEAWRSGLFAAASGGECADHLTLGHARRADGDYAGAIEAYGRAAADQALPAPVRGLAAIYAAETLVASGEHGAARSALEALASDSGGGSHVAWLARQRLDDLDRVEAGKPVWNLERTRTPAVGLPEPAAACYVAVDGSDANPGSADAPFATLERARDAMREARARLGHAPGGATTYVRGGVYRVSKPLTFDAADSGAAGSPTVVRAYPGERPRLTGGVVLHGFASVTDGSILDRLPEEARTHVVQLDIRGLGLGPWPEVAQRGMGIPGKPLLELYCNGNPMRIARWPNTGFVYTGPVSEQPNEFGGHVFAYDGDRPLRWKQARDIWLFGYWYHHWADCTLDVADIDTANRLIRTRLRSPYDVREGQHYFAFNLLEEIDEPGEWYLDRETGLLYLYPTEPLESCTVEATSLAAPFVTIDDAAHLVLAGLTFDVSADSAVVIRRGASCALLGCTLSRLGNDAVVIQGGKDHRVLGCDMHTLARGGIQAACGDRPTLTPGGLIIENNHVYDFSRIDRTYTPAVWLDGVGARIAHNAFHDSPHQAMRIEGNDHRIVFNEVYRVVYETDDQAGLDMWGDPSYRGNEINFNFWHDIASPLERHGQAGIRLDDAICGVRMYGNVFYRSAGGIFGAIQIHGGKENVAENNLFIECAGAVSFSGWGADRWSEMMASDHYRQRVSGEVDIAAPPYSERYPELAGLLEDADRNIVLRNIAVGCEEFLIRNSGANIVADNVQLASDPGFVDASAMDLRLNAGSPAFALGGFQPIPFELMGPYADAWRATWPISPR